LTKGTKYDMSAIWLSEYEKVVVSTGRTGDVPRHPESPGRIVLHTTEGLRTYDYPYPPHFTLGIFGEPRAWPSATQWFPGGSRTLAAGQVLRLQHADLNLASYALLHRSGDPDTNHRGAHCVQVEIISNASDPPHWSAAMYGLVADWLADVVTALPELRPALDNFVAPDKWSEQGSWGFDTPFRMTWQEWDKGINGKPGVPFLCAHQHVPGNDHWDTGALDVVRLTTLAKALLLPDPPAPLTLEQQVLRLRRKVRGLELRVTAMEGKVA
jgi:hypothetical protein